MVTKKDQYTIVVKTNEYKDLIINSGNLILIIHLLGSFWLI